MSAKQRDVQANLGRASCPETRCSECGVMFLQRQLGPRYYTKNKTCSSEACLSAIRRRGGETTSRRKKEDA